MAKEGHIKEREAAVDVTKLGNKTAAAATTAEETRTLHLRLQVIASGFFQRTIKVMVNEFGEL